MEIDFTASGRVKGEIGVKNRISGGGRASRLPPVDFQCANMKGVVESSK